MGATCSTAARASIAPESRTQGLVKPPGTSSSLSSAVCSKNSSTVHYWATGSTCHNHDAYHTIASRTLEGVQIVITLTITHSANVKALTSTSIANCTSTAFVWQ